MLQHLRACLWLLISTVILCCVVYPLLLLGVGQTVFRDKANGSLVMDKEGHPAGSRLIAQPFQGNEYFQPRPSAASYNAAASGASNLAANNYLLRDRVARQIGPNVKFRGTPPHGKTVQEEVADWFKKQPDPVTDWANAHQAVAQAWVNADDDKHKNAHKNAVTQWQEKHSMVADEAVVAFKKDHDGADPKPADLAVPFFKDNAAVFHKEWPKLIDDATWTVAAVFFDAWLQDNPDADLEQVPADLVMSSGSGLDPHITLKNALDYQLDRVAGEWARKTRGDRAVIRKEIADLLNRKAEAPLGGLVGVKLVNVLEINLMLHDQYEERVVAETK
jgi:K+-transporting ATPase ATPase C chain